MRVAAGECCVLEGATADESLLRQAWEIHRATRKESCTLARMEWLYRQNPDGGAVIWTVRANGEDEVAGFTVALPRRMVVDGQQRICWNGADFSILPAYRTLGLAIKLRRAAKEAIDCGRADFLYAHPNERMAVIHARVGHTALGKMVRYARVLRSEAYWSERTRNRSAGWLLGKVTDPLLRLAGRELRHRRSLAVRIVPNARFDDRFDHLFGDTTAGHRVVGVRDARYLNWRYADNPLYRTDAVIAEEGKRLRGYLLFVVEQGTAHVKDIYPPGDDVVSRDLIATLLRHAYEQRLRSVSFVALESNPVLACFREFGFRQRPGTSQMFVYAHKDSAWQNAVMDCNAWFLTVGDRDI